jgi:hypothetical protein
VGRDFGGDMRESGSRLQDSVAQERKQPGADAFGGMVAGRCLDPAWFQQSRKLRVLEYSVLLSEVIGNACRGKARSSAQTPTRRSVACGWVWSFLA